LLWEVIDMEFPATPLDGDTHQDDQGRVWTYTAATNKWDCTASPFGGGVAAATQQYAEDIAIQMIVALGE